MQEVELSQLPNYIRFVLVLPLHLKVLLECPLCYTHRQIRNPDELGEQ